MCSSGLELYKVIRLKFVREGEIEHSQDAFPEEKAVILLTTWVTN